ncbi:MAG TPA: cob(I)yrinic acid a,c-diamide adenosyltransferase [Candidatus Paceibacterota bacterium]|jgi:cob(I)alamin adenosyltransferase|nr:cob(I)yrinic acid a,c-diamide adenosyltransferase [Candidatus Paceibacterota bacterium]
MKSIKKKFKENTNILYTGFGDKGTTTLFGCKQERISKSAHIIEALGAVDELNAYLGVVKVYSAIDKLNIEIGGKKILYDDIIGGIQQTLFVIQAEIAGSKMTVGKKEVVKIEKIINKIGHLLPTIKAFTVSGGSILSAELDVARTLARRAERRIISVVDEKKKIIGPLTIAYMNRLSSALFALSRYTNHMLSIPEDYPRYHKK